MALCRTEYDAKRHANNGSFGTFARAHTDFLVRMPDEMSFEEASAVAFQSLVAFQVSSRPTFLPLSADHLTDYPAPAVRQAFNFPAWPIQMDEGEWVLITGGSSIIGESQSDSRRGGKSRVTHRARFRDSPPDGRRHVCDSDRALGRVSGHHDL
jgi:hypothetical protein